MIQNPPATAVPAEVDIEWLHDLAHRSTPPDLPALLDWLTTADTYQRASRVEDTLAELGIPEPDWDENGDDVPGSVLRKLLYWAHVAAVVDFFDPAGADARRLP